MHRTHPGAKLALERGPVRDTELTWPKANAPTAPRSEPFRIVDDRGNELRITSTNDAPVAKVEPVVIEGARSRPRPRTPLLSAALAIALLCSSDPGPGGRR